jgi:hypothetical protein
MKKIKEFRISLMEKDSDFSLNEENKGNYIIRTTGKFLPEEYIQKLGVETEEEFKETDYLEFIGNAMLVIYDNLMEESKDKKVDTVGVWVTFDDDKTIDSAMDISVIKALEEYHTDIIPAMEFFKMTLQPYYESELS